MSEAIEGIRLAVRKNKKKIEELEDKFKTGTNAYLKAFNDGYKEAWKKMKEHSVHNAHRIDEIEKREREFNWCGLRDDVNKLEQERDIIKEYLEKVSKIYAKLKIPKPAEERFKVQETKPLIEKVAELGELYQKSKQITMSQEELENICKNVRESMKLMFINELEKILKANIENRGLLIGQLIREWQKI